MKWMKLLAVLVCAACTASFLSGCEDGGDSGPVPPSVDVTGVWNSASATEHLNGTIVMTLSQNGSAVSGTFYDSHGESGTVSGSVSGDTITFRASYTNSGWWVDFTGTASGGTMSGSYSASDGSTGSMSWMKQ